MPLTFDYSLDDDNFESDIGHFLRYFKGMEMFNHLKSRSDLQHVPDQDYWYLMDKFGQSKPVHGTISRTSSFRGSERHHIKRKRMEAIHNVRLEFPL
jgi:hypothetical protein